MDEDTLVLTFIYRGKLDKNSEYLPYTVLNSFDPIASRPTIDSYVSKVKALTGEEYMFIPNVGV